MEKPAKDFNLMTGEKIIEEIKPLPELRTYIFITMFPIVFFFLFFFGGFFAAFFTIGLMSLASLMGVGVFVFGLLIFLVLLVLVFAGPWLLSGMSYEKYHYWITNKRLIVKKGIIGYHVTSIPYERISDIIVSRSFIENIIGIASLHVQTLAGQITRGSRFGGEGALLAIPNPEETQSKILNLTRRHRKSEKLSF